MDKQALKKLIKPFVTLFALAAVLLLWHQDFFGLSRVVIPIAQNVVFYLLSSAFGLSIAWLAVRLIDVFIWRTLESRLRSPIPRLLKDLTAALVFLTAAITIFGVVFQQDVGGLWAASGVAGLVIGFALKSLIADVFCGIAINVDQPFRIGDWVQIHPRSAAALKGCVMELSWRSTRIRTTDNSLVVVPNSMISSMVLTNFSKPGTQSRFELVLCFDFGVPTERAMRVLMAGVQAAPGLLEDPAPKVMVNGLTQWGVEYKVRYWVEPTAVSPRRARHGVATSILEHLYHAGITPAYSKQDVFLAEMPSRQLDRGADRVEILRRVELFSSLEGEEIRQLSALTREHRHPAGQVLVQQGDPGESMYVLVEGLLGVYSDRDHGAHPIKLDNIRPGEFFGEMSLLTGEKRTASVLTATDAVVFEIGKEAFTTILEQRPEIAVHIAHVVAERRLNMQRKSQETPTAVEENAHTFAENVLERMKGFFSCLRDRLPRRKGHRPRPAATSASRDTLPTPVPGS